MFADGTLSPCVADSRAWPFALLLAGGLAPISLADTPPPADPGWNDRFAPPAPPALAEDERTRLDAGEVVVRDLPPTDRTASACS